jgi:hypothetical protein
MPMGSSVVLATISGVLLIAQLIVAKAARDTLFLSSFPVTALPIAAIGTAIAMLPAVFAGSLLITKAGPQRFLPGFLLINALGFSAEWATLATAPRLVAGCLYLHAGLFGGLSISGFWSVINERFDPHAARRVASRIGFGFALGGLLGGLLAEWATTWFGVRALLALLAVTNVILTVIVTSLGRAHHAHVAPAKEVSGLQTLARSRYLMAMAIVVVLVAVASSALDYSFKSTVSAVVGQPAKLAKFFANYYMVTSVFTAVLQLTLARYTLQKAGIGVTLAVLPTSLLVGGVFSGAMGGLWPVVLLRGAEAVLSASFFRSAYEPLYAPLPAPRKRATKAIIDVAADKLGDAMGSGGIWLALALVPSHIWHASLLIVMASAGIVLWLVLQLQKGYVSELANSLRTGVVRLASQDVEDATTRLTVSRTFSGISRDLVLREIAAARKEHVEDPEVVRVATELSSGDADRIVAELDAGVLDSRFTGLVIPLLEYGDTREAAQRALQGIADKCIGQLSDALLDAQVSPMIRYRIPALMSRVSSPRSVDGLAGGLADEDFEVRERCARALLAIRRRNLELCPPQAQLAAAVQRELSVPEKTWAGRGATISIEDSGLSQIASSTANRSLQHVFTLMGLWLQPQELELSLRALASQDPKLRGTALEYLENVVPTEVKAALWPHISDQRAPTEPGARSHKEIADELKRSFA